MIDKTISNIFKATRTVIKLKRLNKIANELCDVSGRQSCRNCPAFIYDRDTCTAHCALSRVIELGLDKWSLKEDETEGD